MGIITNIIKVSVNITVIIELVLLIGYSTAETGGWILFNNWNYPFNILIQTTHTNTRSRPSPSLKKLDNFTLNFFFTFAYRQRMHLSRVSLKYNWLS